MEYIQHHQARNGWLHDKGNRKDKGKVPHLTIASSSEGETKKKKCSNHPNAKKLEKGNGSSLYNAIYWEFQTTQNPTQ